MKLEKCEFAFPKGNIFFNISFEPFLSLELEKSDDKMNQSIFTKFDNKMVLIL